MAQRQRICLPVLEVRVQTLDGEDPTEKEMATHSRILAWRIPCTEEPCRLQSMGSQRVKHNLVTKTNSNPLTYSPHDVWVQHRGQLPMCAIFSKEVYKRLPESCKSFLTVTFLLCSSSFQNCHILWQLCLPLFLHFCEQLTRIPRISYFMNPLSKIY